MINKKVFKFAMVGTSSHIVSFASGLGRALKAIVLAERPEEEQAVDDLDRGIDDAREPGVPAADGGIESDLSSVTPGDSEVDLSTASLQVRLAYYSRLAVRLKASVSSRAFRNLASGYQSSRQTDQAAYALLSSGVFLLNLVCQSMNTDNQGASRQQSRAELLNNGLQMMALVCLAAPQLFEWRRHLPSLAEAKDKTYQLVSQSSNHAVDLMARACDQLSVSHVKACGQQQVEAIKQLLHVAEVQPYLLMYVYLWTWYVSYLNQSMGALTVLDGSMFLAGTSSRRVKVFRALGQVGAAVFPVSRLLQSRVPMWQNQSDFLVSAQSLLQGFIVLLGMIHRMNQARNQVKSNPHVKLTLSVDSDKRVSGDLSLTGASKPVHALLGGLNGLSIWLEEGLPMHCLAAVVTGIQSGAFNAGMVLLPSVLASMVNHHHDIKQWVSDRLPRLSLPAVALPEYERVIQLMPSASPGSQINQLGPMHWMMTVGVLSMLNASSSSTTLLHVALGSLPLLPHHPEVVVQGLLTMAGVSLIDDAMLIVWLALVWQMTPTLAASQSEESREDFTARFHLRHALASVYTASHLFAYLTQPVCQLWADPKNLGLGVLIPSYPVLVSGFWSAAGMRSLFSLSNPEQNFSHWVANTKQGGLPRFFEQGIGDAVQMLAIMGLPSIFRHGNHLLTSATDASVSILLLFALGGLSFARQGNCPQWANPYIRRLHTSLKPLDVGSAMLADSKNVISFLSNESMPAFTLAFYRLWCSYRRSQSHTWGPRVDSASNPFKSLLKHEILLDMNREMHTAFPPLINEFSKTLTFEWIQDLMKQNHFCIDHSGQARYHTDLYMHWQNCFSENSENQQVLVNGCQSLCAILASHYKRPLACLDAINNQLSNPDTAARFNQGVNGWLSTIVDIRLQPLLSDLGSAEFIHTLIQSLLYQYQSRGFDTQDFYLSDVYLNHLALTYHQALKKIHTRYRQLLDDQQFGSVLQLSEQAYKSLRVFEGEDHCEQLISVVQCQTMDDLEGLAAETKTLMEQAMDHTRIGVLLRSPMGLASLISKDKTDSFIRNPKVSESVITMIIENRIHANTPTQVLPSRLIGLLFNQDELSVSDWVDLLVTNPDNQGGIRHWLNSLEINLNSPMRQLLEPLVEKLKTHLTMNTIEGLKDAWLGSASDESSSQTQRSDAFDDFFQGKPINQDSLLWLLEESLSLLSSPTGQLLVIGWVDAINAFSSGETPRHGAAVGSSGRPRDDGMQRIIEIIKLKLITDPGVQKDFNQSLKYLYKLIENSGHQPLVLLDRLKTALTSHGEKIDSYLEDLSTTEPSPVPATLVSQPLKTETLVLVMQWVLNQYHQQSTENHSLYAVDIGLNWLAFNHQATLKVVRLHLNSLDSDLKSPLDLTMMQQISMQVFESPSGVKAIQALCQCRCSTDLNELTSEQTAFKIMLDDPKRLEGLLDNPQGLRSSFFFKDRDLLPKVSSHVRQVISHAAQTEQAESDFDAIHVLSGHDQFLITVGYVLKTLLKQNQAQTMSVINLLSALQIDLNQPTWQALGPIFKFAADGVSFSVLDSLLKQACRVDDQGVASRYQSYHEQWQQLTKDSLENQATIAAGLSALLEMAQESVPNPLVWIKQFSQVLTRNQGQFDQRINHLINRGVDKTLQPLTKTLLTANNLQVLCQAIQDYYQSKGMDDQSMSLDQCWLRYQAVVYKNTVKRIQVHLKALDSGIKHACDLNPYEKASLVFIEGKQSASFYERLSAISDPKDYKKLNHQDKQQIQCLMQTTWVANQLTALPGVVGQQDGQLRAYVLPDSIKQSTHRESLAESQSGKIWQLLTGQGSLSAWVIAIAGHNQGQVLLNILEASHVDINQSLWSCLAPWLDKADQQKWFEKLEPLLTRVYPNLWLEEHPLSDRYRLSQQISEEGFRSGSGTSNPSVLKPWLRLDGFLKDSLQLVDETTRQLQPVLTENPKQGLFVYGLALLRHRKVYRDFWLLVVKIAVDQWKVSASLFEKNKPKWQRVKTAIGIQAKVCWQILRWMIARQGLRLVACVCQDAARLAWFSTKKLAEALKKRLPNITSQLCLPMAYQNSKLRVGLSILVYTATLLAIMIASPMSAPIMSIGWISLLAGFNVSVNVGLSKKIMRLPGFIYKQVINACVLPISQTRPMMNRLVTLLVAGGLVHASMVGLMSVWLASALGLIVPLVHHVKHALKQAMVSVLSWPISIRSRQSAQPMVSETLSAQGKAQIQQEPIKGRPSRVDNQPSETCSTTQKPSAGG